MKYKIGDVSRAFCLSKNTLRYYEEHGILTPAHQDGSDYRYYDNEQMHRIGSLKKLRNMGLSVDEIQEFLPGSTVDRVEELMEKHLLEEERQAEVHRYLADKLRSDLERIRDRKSYGRITHRTLPERYEMGLCSIENLVVDRKLQKYAPAWFDQVFPVMNIHRLKTGDVEQGLYRPSFALMVDAPGAELLGLDTKNPFVRFLPAQDCLNACSLFDSFQNGDSPGFLYLEQCRSMLEQCRLEGLEPTDDFSFNILFSCRTPEGKPQVIGDIYLPVRRAET